MSPQTSFWRSVRKKLPKYSDFAAKLAVGLLSSLLGSVLGATTNKLWRRFLAFHIKDSINAHPISYSVLIGFAVLLVGLALCLWKKREGLSYGLVEVGFGVGVGFVVMLNLSPNFEATKILTIASCVYIVSRGFNNVFEAQDPEWFKKLDRRKVQSQGVPSMTN